MYANGNDLGEHNKTFFDLFKKMVKKSPDELNLNPTNDDRYKFEKMLGRGASGLVYKAWDKRHKRHVAVKVSKKEANYLVSEARLAGKLEHENIVSIYDSYSSPGISYIIMESATNSVFLTRKSSTAGRWKRPINGCASATPGRSPGRSGRSR